MREKLMVIFYLSAFGLLISLILLGIFHIKIFGAIVLILFGILMIVFLIAIMFIKK